MNKTVKIILAVLGTLVFLIQGFIMPLFWRWYETTFNLSGDQMFLPFIIIFFLEFGLLGVCIVLWSLLIDEN